MADQSSEGTPLRLFCAESTDRIATARKKKEMALETVKKLQDSLNVRLYDCGEETDQAKDTKDSSVPSIMNNQKKCVDPSGKSPASSPCGEDTDVVGNSTIMADTDTPARDSTADKETNLNQASEGAAFTADAKTNKHVRDSTADKETTPTPAVRLAPCSVIAPGSHIAHRNTVLRRELLCTCMAVGVGSTTNTGEMQLFTSCGSLLEDTDNVHCFGNEKPTREYRPEELSMQPVEEYRLECGQLDGYVSLDRRAAPHATEHSGPKQKKRRTVRRFDDNLLETKQVNKAAEDDAMEHHVLQPMRDAHGYLADDVLCALARNSTVFVDTHCFAYCRICGKQISFKAELDPSWCERVHTNARQAQYMRTNCEKYCAHPVLWQVRGVQNHVVARSEMRPRHTVHVVVDVLMYSVLTSPRGRELLKETCELFKRLDPVVSHELRRIHVLNFGNKLFRWVSAKLKSPSTVADHVRRQLNTFDKEWRTEAMRAKAKSLLMEHEENFKRGMGQEHWLGIPTAFQFTLVDAFAAVADIFSNQYMPSIVHLPQYELFRYEKVDPDLTVDQAEQPTQNSRRLPTQARVFSDLPWAAISIPPANQFRCLGTQPTKIPDTRQASPVHRSTKIREAGQASPVHLSQFTDVESYSMKAAGCK